MVNSEPCAAWLDRAVGASPIRAMSARACGGESLDWRSLCPHCGAFDTLSWRTPAWAVPDGKSADADRARSAPEPASAAERAAGRHVKRAWRPTLEQAKNQPLASPR